MLDQIFENPRLVEIYDAFDGTRHDLSHYVDIVTEFNARSVLDVGCGTGTFCCLLGQAGYTVFGLDPAKASLDFAMTKPHSENVRWILGDTSNLPPLQVDMAVMTGNVAQVFLTDEAWEQNLQNIRKSLSHRGKLVFETRDPAKEAWKNWIRDKTHQRINVPEIGFVEGWCELADL